MTIDDYKRNLRGVNGGQDFDPEYLVSLVILKARSSSNIAVGIDSRVHPETRDHFAGRARRAAWI